MKSETKIIKSKIVHKYAPSRENLPTEVVAIANIKGGVAKTSTSIMLAQELAERGYKTLIIDMDPQANATACLMDSFDKYLSDISVEDLRNLLKNVTRKEVVKTIIQSKDKKTLFDFFEDNSSISDTIYHYSDNLDIIPGDLNLSQADIKYTSMINSQRKFEKAVNSIKNLYDFIIIDCPPSLNFLTISAFFAATNIIAPVNADVFSLNGLLLLKDTIDLINDNREISKVRILGTVVTMYKSNTNLAHTIETFIEKAAVILDTDVFVTRIPSSVKIAESQSKKTTISKIAPGTRIATKCEELVDEFLTRI